MTNQIFWQQINQLIWPQRIFLWQLYPRNNNSVNKSELNKFCNGIRFSKSLKNKKPWIVFLQETSRDFCCANSCYYLCCCYFTSSVVSHFLVFDINPHPSVCHRHTYPSEYCLILNFQLNPFQSDLRHVHFILPITFHCDVVVLVVGLFVTVLVDVVPCGHCNKTYDKMQFKNTYYLYDGDIKKCVIYCGRMLISMSAWLAGKDSLQTC